MKDLYDDLPDLTELRAEKAADDSREADGQVLAELCAEKAERLDWDRDGATRFILAYLERNGPTSGEVLVTASTHHFRPHDGRAYGAIFGTLSRRGIICKAGYTLRVEKGHGAPGAVIWQLAEAGG